MGAHASSFPIAILCRFRDFFEVYAFVMDISLWASVGSAVVAAGSLWVSVLSRRDGKRANGLSKVANETSAQSMRVASSANNLAEDANKLAEDANSLSERALAASTDNLRYLWLLHIDDDSRSVIVVNDCPHEALDVVVVVAAEGDSVASRLEKDLSAFGKLVLNLSGLFDEHFEKVAKNPSRGSRQGDGVFVSGRKGKTVVTPFAVHISWVTPTGIPRSEIVEDALRHGDNKGVVERR